MGKPQPILTVLEGGRSLPAGRMRRVLVHAYVTDTRLMGVLALCLHWSIASPAADGNDPDSWEDLHQFFYIDCEEAGLESYQQVRGSRDQLEDLQHQAALMEEALVCGLGANKVEITERQLRLILQHWARFNKAHQLPLPAGQAQYGFLLEPELAADEAERQELMALLCPDIRSDAQAVNYFLMRCFGQDEEGARTLTASPDVNVRLYARYQQATFCRNAIEEAECFPDGARKYYCESLVEMDGQYETVTSTVVVRNRRIAYVRHGSSLPITQTEAAMILKKVEYVTLYEVFLTDDELEANLDEFTLGFHATMSEYENGRLFMTFRATNDHVDSRLFKLSDDVRGMYFLTHNRQLVLCAYQLQDLYYLEQTIAASVLAPYLIPSAHYNFVPGGGYRPGGIYEFHEPILYEFMRSDYDHFEEFLAALRGE